MKRIVFIAAFIAATGAMTDTSAQVTIMRSIRNNGDKTGMPPPRQCARTYKCVVSLVSYNASSTLLTVKFPSNSQGGTVEVFRDGTKVAGITTKGGTTFSCRLREYGAGNYAVIVSNGKTVVDSKNYIVK